ncbi:MAG: hypothetical protein ACI81R_001041 [Bradymonadia bacterium]|jgi:hypothetical protein
MSADRCASALLAIAMLAPLVLPNEAHAWEHNIADWPVERLPLPIALRPEPARDTSSDELARIIQETFDTWNEVSCSYVELAFDGVQDLPVAVDDDQVFAWIADGEVWIYGSQSAGATIIDVLGENGPRIDIAFNDVNFDWIVGANTLVLPDYEFGVDPNLEVDPGSVITHEVGHLLGLAHPRPSDELSQPDALATMVFALLPNAQQSSLAADDKLGLCEKYPVPDAHECETDEDCADETFCRTLAASFGDIRLCEESRGTFGDFCSVDEYICEAQCLFTAADFSAGYCTDFCETNDDCPLAPERFICVELQTTADPVLACVPDNGTGGIEAEGPESDVGIVEEEPDAGAEEAEEIAEPEADVAPDAPEDAGADEAEDDGEEGGCTLASSAPSMLWILPLLCWRTRRRG